jgi:hypothetical protein
MNAAVLALFFFLPSLIGALQITDSSSVTSTTADYDGNTLLLKGNVKLDHGLGKMSAEEAGLERQDSGKDFPFSLIHLRKEVVLHLKNNAELHCEGADLDFISMKGRLSAADNGNVFYTTPLKKKGSDSKELLRLLSKYVDIELTKKDLDGKKSTYDMQSLLAREQVQIEYGNQFVLNADKALYRKQLVANKQAQEIITAAPKDANSKCRLTYGEDIIDADSVDLDVLEGKVTMYRPKGMLSSSLVPHGQQGGLYFTCHHLLWENAKNTLVLKGDVEVSDMALGTVNAEEIKLVQTVSKGKRILQSIQSKAKATLRYQDTAKSSMHKLVCHGPLKFDRERLFASLESPFVDGAVPDGLQIYYEETEFATYANKASIEYSLVGKQLIPASIQLFGDVRIFSIDPKKPPRKGVADRVSYLPNTKTLILAADPGKKVLFWDEEQDLRISAPEVHITKDPTTNKDQVKGLGKVQFVFTAEEDDFLNNLFKTHE